MSKAFEKNMVTSYHMRTICEVLREIYWCTDDEVVRTKILEASSMAKRMDAKLREYKVDWDKTEWKQTKRPEEKAKERRKKYEVECAVKR